ncbi:MAG: efflux RND transporter periplasmic adaptor subunit [Terriglobia bacterium]|jgi:cobalt-zinc-cadmium efflux system membrane fusion protein
MKNHSHAITALILVACLAPWLSSSCSRGSSADHPPPVTVEKAPDLTLVEVPDPEQFPLTTVEQRLIYNELKVNGVVTPDVNRSVPVLSLAGGRVVDIRAKLGDDVTKGQVLLRINSPDVSQAFSDYQKAQADEVLARRQQERSETLLARGAIAQRDLEAAEDVEQKAKVDLATAAEHLRVLGADVSHASPIVDVKSPISGTIVEQNITGGTGVRSIDNSPNLFTVADLSRVWVLCDVYENNLAQVRLGDFAEVRLNAYPDQALKGRVSNISRVLDPSTRTAKVRLELDNERRQMRAGMFATATFRSQSKQLRSLVPAKAVLRLHDKDWVFRAEGGHRFRRIEVQAGRVSSDGFQEVIAGLAPGDQIVANALQFASAADTE